MERIAVLLGALGLIGVAIWYNMDGTLEPLESRFEAACHAEAADRLLDRSSFRLLRSSDVSVRQATVDDYFGWEHKAKRDYDRKMMEADPKIAELRDTMRQIFGRMESPVVYRLTIIYDGRILGSVLPTNGGTCTLVQPADKVPDDDTIRFRLRLNGFLHSEWGLYKLSKLR